MSHPEAPPVAAYRIRLQDPHQPARLYDLEATTERQALREARPLADGVLVDGTVELLERQPDGDYPPVRTGRVAANRTLRWD